MKKWLMGQVDQNLFNLVNLKNKLLMRDYSNKYYSQSGEDIILSQIFKNKSDGFYVDVGAYHPFHYSNTYLLYKRGWRGINIDPNPKSIQLFDRHRDNDVNLNIGVSSEQSKLTYHIYNHQSYNTFSGTVAEENKKLKHLKLLEKENVETRLLREVLNKYANNHKIDLLNIDAEGMDLEVLKSNDWNKFRPTVVVVENSSFNLEDSQSDKIYKFMKEENYKLYATTGLSLIFLNKNG